MAEVTILNGGAEYKYMTGHTLSLSIVGTGCVLLVNPNTPIILKELIDHE